MGESLWSNIFREKRKPEDTVAGMLGKVPLFDGLKPRELARVVEFLHRREYQPGEVVFGQGVPGFGMYIIEKGAVDIVHEGSGGVLAELADGDFFGELALLSSAPRSAAAVARTESVMYGFFHSDLKSLIEHNPKMGVKIVLRLAGIIGERLVKANEHAQALQRELEKVVRSGPG